MRAYLRENREWTAALAVCAVLAVVQPAAAQTPACEPNANFNVCAKWDSGTPVHGFDFSVAFNGSNPPDIELRTGRTDWTIYCETTGGSPVPAAFGIVTIDQTLTNSVDFVVKIAKGAGAGATNIDFIYLDAPSWTGYSSLASGSVISGDPGYVTVVADSSNEGGAVSLTCGSLDFGLRAAVVDALIIEGDLAGEIEVLDRVEKLLEVAGNVDGSAEIMIDGLAADAVLDFNTDRPTVTGDFQGELLVMDGIPSSTTLRVRGAMDGTIDLQSGDVAGTLDFKRGGGGDVINGGEVTSTGRVYLANFSTFEELPWSGLAEFGAIQSGGFDEDDPGFVKVIRAQFTGTIEVGRSGWSGDNAGLIAIEGGTFSGGDIILTGDSSGAIEARGMAMAGVIDVAGDLDGDNGPARILVGASVLGNIVIDGSLTGVAKILIGGSMQGDIAIGGSLTDVARILVYGSLVNGTGHEIEIIGTMGLTTGICIDADGWDFFDSWGSSATIAVGEGTYTENTPSERIWETQPCRGDLNNDGCLNNFDIDPFVEALTDEPSYFLSYPALEDCRVYHGDANCDLSFDNFDVDPFLDLIFETTCTTTCENSISCGMAAGASRTVEQTAAMLRDNVADRRFSAMLGVIADLARDHPSGDRREFWEDVLVLLEAR